MIATRHKRGHAHKEFGRIQRLDKPVQDFDDTPAAWVDYTADLPDGVTLGTLTPLKSGETIEGQKVTHQVSHQWEMRWQPGITSGMRLLIDDQDRDASRDYDEIPDKRVLHIESVINVEERRQDLILLCEEVTQ